MDLDMLASYYTLIGGPYICAFKMSVPYNCRALEVLKMKMKILLVAVKT